MGLQHATHDGHEARRLFGYVESDLHGRLKIRHAGGNGRAGRPVIFGQIYDPLSTRTLPNGTVIRDPFPGNIIPQTRFDPVAAQRNQERGIQDPQYDTLLRNIERVGTCCPFFDLHIFGLKIDQNISDKHHISGFYNQSYRNRNNNGASRYLPLPGLPTSSWQQQTTPGNMGRVAVDSTMTTTLLNRFAGRLQPVRE